jgi:putative transcriptional regulator
MRRAIAQLAWTALFFACAALAQTDAVVLVAKPELADPNFGEAVVLVTHTPTGETIGVVLNRPLSQRLAEVAPQFPRAATYRDPLWRGGPVLPKVIVALFHAPAKPEASAFKVLPDTYLSLHPKNIDALLENPAGRFRLFAGFCGWAEGQLEAEIESDSWYVLPATEEVLFRSETSGMWRELVDAARGRRTAFSRESRGIY